jgi:hypothetical protein
VILNKDNVEALKFSAIHVQLTWNPRACTLTFVSLAHITALVALHYLTCPECAFVGSFAVRELQQTPAPDNESIVF